MKRIRRRRGPDAYSKGGRYVEFSPRCNKRRENIGTDGVPALRRNPAVEFTMQFREFPFVPLCAPSVFSLLCLSLPVCVYPFHRASLSRGKIFTSPLLRCPGAGFLTRGAKGMGDGAKLKRRLRRSPANPTWPDHFSSLRFKEAVFLLISRLDEAQRGRRVRGIRRCLSLSHSG